MTYGCIIVDDEELDRLMVAAHIKKHPFLEIKGIYDQPLSALQEIEKTQPQVLFLDIDMGEMSGLELREQLMDVEACIFITSYPDYAAESFDVAALDFLIKPLNSERFSRTMQRLESYLHMRRKSDLFDHSLQGDAIFIKDGHQQIKLRSSDILYLEALKDYTLVVTRDKKHCVLSSIGNLLKDNAFHSFIRIHRSYAVQRHFIGKISAHEILVENIPLPVGRSYKETLRQLFPS